MNKRKAETVFFALLLFLAPSSLQAGQSVQLTDTDYMAELPFIKVMQTGEIMVVYSLGTHFNSDSVLMYRILDPESGSWSTAEQAVAKSTSSAYAQIWEAPDGDLHMTYHDGNSSAVRDIFYAMYDLSSGQWVRRSKAYISSGVNSTWPRIRGDGDRLFIVWSHNYDSSIGVMDLTMIENTVGGSWPVDQKSRLTISDTPQSVSVHGDFDYQDGRVYCCWMDDNHNSSQWNIYYNEGVYDETSATWTFGTSERLFPESSLQYYPAIAADESGIVHMIYSYKTNPWYYTQKVGDTWSSPKAISTASADFNMMAVLEYAGGLLHTVIRQGSNVYYLRGLTDGTWTDPLLIHQGEFPSYPGIDVDANGDAHVVFSDGDASDIPRNIFYVKVELDGEAPIAALTADSAGGPLPLVVQFDASGSSDSDGDIIDYRWNFGDGASAAGENQTKISHTFESEGTFTVTLTVIDDDLRSDTESLDIVVSSGPLAVISASPVRGTVPLTVLFDGSQSEGYTGTIVSWSWDFGDGETGAGTTVSHTYQHGGDYTATLTVTDDAGRTGEALVAIEARESPVASMTVSPSMGKIPLEVVFDAGGSYDPDGNIQSYIWDFGYGPDEGPCLTTHIFTAAGTYTVTLEVVDDDGLSAVASESVRALGAPLAPLSISVERIVNKAFLTTEYINRISWVENPENPGLFDVAAYRVYRASTGTDGYALAGETDGSTLFFEDRGFLDTETADAATYTVTAVDADGSETPLDTAGTTGTQRNSPRRGDVRRLKR